MLILLSPAKIQNFEPQQITTIYTQPSFLKEAEMIVTKIRHLSALELTKLLDINFKLGQINADRYFNWGKPFTVDNAKQAVLVFNGEVFHGLDAKNFSNTDFEYAQSNMCILSGLYGALRPLDLIQPYRLEISTVLRVDNTKDIYSFWGNKLTEWINKVLKNSDTPKTILNLASNEYFKSINRSLLKAEVIDIEFLENKNDVYKPIVMYTKKARGLMARYVITNQIKDKEDLRGFSAEGYWYSESRSTENKMVFTRG